MDGGIDGKSPLPPRVRVRVRVRVRQPGTRESFSRNVASLAMP